MALRKMPSKIRIRAGSYQHWYDINPVLMEREISFVMTGTAVQQGRFKIGDGVTAWRNLPFTASRFPDDILQLADEIASSSLPDSGDIKLLFQKIRNYLKWETQTREAADNQLQQNINAEEQARQQADNELQISINAEREERIHDILVANDRIDRVENMGDYAGSFATRAALPSNASSFPHGITINDFATIEVDETRDGKATKYVVSWIDDFGDIVWNYDFTYTTDITGKTDKVANPVNGNFAGLNAQGNLTDSGKKAADFAPVSVVTTKADKVANATSGNLVAMDAQGNLTDSGVTAQDIQEGGILDIATQLASKAPIANPTFAGLPQVPSKATPVQNWPTRIATEAQVYLVKEAAMLLNGSGNLASLPYCGNYDINTLRTPGFYSGYFVNTPYGNAICGDDNSWYNASDGNCVVVPINNTRTKQFFCPENSPLVFHRTSTSPSAWGPWKTFANTDSPYLSGTPTVDEITNVPLTRNANSDTLNNWGNQIVGMNTLRNALIKNNFPAGMYYTQYPKAGETDYANMFPASEAPATLFGGTWTPVYESEAVYFRTGNEANKGSKRGQQWNPGTKQYEAGAAGIEPDAIKDITAGGIVGRGTGTGAFSTNGLNSIGLVSGSSWYFASDSNTSSLVENTFMASRAVPTDDTNHPKNRLFKVWKKNA